MTQLDRESIKKLETGELWGIIATVFCGAVFVYFILLFTLVWVRDDGLLEIIMWSTAPALMAIGIAASAYCNFKFGAGIERQINEYAVQVFVENAPLMHPEKDSLTFFFNVEGKTVEVTVNGYKEKIIFDFSAFKRFSAIRQTTVLKIISDRLAATFCRLYERGTTYKSVEYRLKSKGRTVKIISDGAPDKKIMKNYLKNR